MKVEIELNRKFVKELGAYAFQVLIYYTAYYEATGKVQSMTSASKELGMSYLKLRGSLARIYLVLNINEYLNSEKYKIYKFIRERARGAYETEHKRDKARNEKDKDERVLWASITSRIQDNTTQKISTNFFWRTQKWMSNLINKIGREKISSYTDWFIKNKLKSVGKFNAGIFSCDSMIREFKIYRRKKKKNDSQLNIEKKDFKGSLGKQDEKMMKSILKKPRDSWDEYDIENMKYFKEKGYWNGSV